MRLLATDRDQRQDHERDKAPHIKCVDRAGEGKLYQAEEGCLRQERGR